MPNTFKDNSFNLAAVASVLIAKDLKVASLVNQAFSADFDGKRGASMNVRIPASLAAQNRAVGSVAAYSTSDLTEATQAVALTLDYYSRTAIADSDLTLSVEDYVKQVLHPQTRAIAIAIEGAVIAKLQTVVEDATLDTAYDPSDKTKIMDFLVDIRAKLRSLGAPEDGLNIALSVDAYAALLKAVGSASFDQGVGDMASGKVIRDHPGDEGSGRRRGRRHERQREGRPGRARARRAGVRPHDRSAHLAGEHLWWHRADDGQRRRRQRQLRGPRPRVTKPSRVEPPTGRCRGSAVGAQLHAPPPPSRLEPAHMLATLDRPTATMARPKTDAATARFTSLVAKLDAELRPRGRR